MESDPITETVKDMRGSADSLSVLSEAVSEYTNKCEIVSNLIGGASGTSAGRFAEWLFQNVTAATDAKKEKLPDYKIGDRYKSKVNGQEYVIVNVDEKTRRYAYVNVGCFKDPMSINWESFKEVEELAELTFRMPECGTEDEMREYQDYIHNLKPVSFGVWKTIKEKLGK